MLLCLDRDHRVAFVLAEIFDLTGEEGAEVLGISPPAFRKRLQRARERMRAFMAARCGLVSQEAPCRCRRQIAPGIAGGLIDPEHLLFALHPTRARREPEVVRSFRAIESGRRYVAVLRAHPDYVAPPSVLEGFRRLLAEA